METITTETEDRNAERDLAADKAACRQLYARLSGTQQHLQSREGIQLLIALAAYRSTSRNPCVPAARRSGPSFVLIIFSHKTGGLP
jgi:hypothetical protein